MPHRGAGCCRRRRPCGRPLWARAGPAPQQGPLPARLLRFGAQVNTVLMQMPWNDWEIGPSEIEVLQHEDGTDWKLGEGASGSVRACAPPGAARCCDGAARAQQGPPGALARRAADGARGARRQVFKAVRGGQVVAVKIFHDPAERGPRGTPAAQRRLVQSREDLRREISLLRSLHDRNIVNFVGAAIWVRGPRGRARAGPPARRGCHAWTADQGPLSPCGMGAAGRRRGARDGARPRPWLRAPGRPACPPACRPTAVRVAARRTFWSAATCTRRWRRTRSGASAGTAGARACAAPPAPAGLRGRPSRARGSRVTSPPPCPRAPQEGQERAVCAEHGHGAAGRAGRRARHALPAQPLAQGRAL